MFNIKFNQQDSQFLHHERFKDIVPAISPHLSFLKNHFFLFSSGTTSTHPKGYAVSESALFANAKAVNDFFKLTHKDVWGLTLPWFHIGGLSVIARAHLLGSKLIDLTGKWDPLIWVKKIEEENVTITTVVPTQIYDVVRLNIPSPKCLKYIIVGGDLLSTELFSRAVNLGWPVIKTFGMTEICSQLASAKSAEDPSLEVLPIHQIKITQDKRLWIKSQAMFTLEFIFENGLVKTNTSRSRFDTDGFFPTNDLVETRNGELFHLGRIDGQVKINGRLTSVNTLRDELYTFALKNDLYGHLELSIISDERSGKLLEILYDQDFNQEALSHQFSPTKLAYRRVPSFTRTDLGKLKK